MDILLVGGTGLVGRAALAELQRRGGHRLRVLVRKAGALPGYLEVPFPFDDLAAYDRELTDHPPDVVLCALGTTLRAAGSAEAFRTVDLDYPARLMSATARLAPQAIFGLVSSLGAERPRGLYLTVKAQAESALRATGLRHVILRPSLLLGPRTDFRPGEALAQALAPGYLALAKLFPDHEGLWRYAPIPAAQVGQALVRACLDTPPPQGGLILEGRALR